MEGAGALISVSHHPNSVQEASPTSATVSPSVKWIFVLNFRTRKLRNLEKFRLEEGMAVVGWAVKDTKHSMQGVVVRSLEWPQWADRNEDKHRVATGPAQPSWPNNQTGWKGSLPKQKLGNHTASQKNGEVFGPHPPVQGPWWYFVQWKIYPFQIFVMCHISQPVAQADLPAEGFIGPAGGGTEWADPIAMEK